MPGEEKQFYRPNAQASPCFQSSGGLAYAAYKNAIGLKIAVPEQRRLFPSLFCGRIAQRRSQKSLALFCCLACRLILFLLFSDLFCDCCFLLLCCAHAISGTANALTPPCQKKRVCPPLFCGRQTLFYCVILAGGSCYFCTNSPSLEQHRYSFPPGTRGSRSSPACSG